MTSDTDAQMRHYAQVARERQDLIDTLKAEKRTIAADQRYVSRLLEDARRELAARDERDEQLAHELISIARSCKGEKRRMGAMVVVKAYCDAIGLDMYELMREDENDAD